MKWKAALILGYDYIYPNAIGRLGQSEQPIGSGRSAAHLRPPRAAPSCRCWAADVRTRVGPNTRARFRGSIYTSKCMMSKYSPAMHDYVLKKKQRGVSHTVLWSESRPSVKCPAAFGSPRLLRGDDLASLVELILERRHHGVVPGDPVDARVLQTHVLHQTAADLHDQRDELRGEAGFSHA
ncbi:hypothetical protein EYF80_003727 [Liparis tanakae]|uniref:Uncharacterized protein n=1 Tax=Liparis tanakae TaxID=230148 RepID=A0A4Z2J8A7_9TELE|nr:hypothetical protein EYF80_003727 [Liparis tanakae]